jgi:hypothetical protein
MSFYNISSLFLYFDVSHFKQSITIDTIDDKKVISERR